MLREPFFSRGHSGRFGFKEDVADRVARVSDALTAALKISHFPPSASPPPYDMASFASSDDAGAARQSRGSPHERASMQSKESPSPGSLTAARPSGKGDVNEERWKAVEALMRMEFEAGDDAAASLTGRALYKQAKLAQSPIYSLIM